MFVSSVQNTHLAAPRRQTPPSQLNLHAANHSPIHVPSLCSGIRTREIRASRSKGLGNLTQMMLTMK
jgi:hypothetical protein